MREPAYVEPDEHGDFHLLIDGEPKTFRIARDEQGRSHLLPVIDDASCPPEDYVESPELDALLAAYDDAAGLQP
jgi:hypothetical protein